MKKILLAVIVLGSVLLAPNLVYAAACPNPDSATTPIDQVRVGTGTTGSDCGGGEVLNFVTAVVRVLSIIVGVAAVIMIIYSGFKYITSAGDSGKVSSAKSTLIYALIGIIIAVLAQVLVNFVVKQGEVSGNPCQYNSNIAADDRNCRPPED